MFSTAELSTTLFRDSQLKNGSKLVLREPPKQLLDADGNPVEESDEDAEEEGEDEMIEEGGEDEISEMNEEGEAEMEEGDDAGEEEDAENFDDLEKSEAAPEEENKGDKSPRNGKKQRIRNKAGFADKVRNDNA